MEFKKTLQKIGEWVEDAGKAATGAFKASLDKGPLREMLEDFAAVGGPIGIVFKIAARQISEPTADQIIILKLSNTFSEQLHKARVEHPELCQEDTWRTFVKGKGRDKANELLSREFSWFSLFGKGELLPSRSWPLVTDLADIAELWLTGAAAADGRLTLDNRRLIETIRGRMATELAKSVEAALQMEAVRIDLEQAIASLGREALDRLAERHCALECVRLFGEMPQNELYIPPSLKCLDFRGNVPEGAIQWRDMQTVKGDASIKEQIKCDDPRLIVLFGDMGAGKSCLMRALTASAARQYLRDKKLAPVFVRWRDIYQKSDLLESIASRVRDEHGLPTEDLARQNNVVYFLDGFDEMTSHQSDHIRDQFERVLKLVIDKRHTVVIAMRSTVVTPSIQRAWREKGAFVVEIQPFTNAEVDGWTVQWQRRTLDVQVTGERMRQLAGKDVTANPLLLYMLARYVHPVASGPEKLGRGAVFCTFVDETISGRLRTVDEKYPLNPENAGKYRLLLQEMAFIASWPSSNGKCVEHTLRQEISESRLNDLGFRDLRSAFVMHFFDPGDSLRGEYEFQPEGFRHYLLAEWCVRRQLEAHQDEIHFRTGGHQLSRANAIQSLAQFPLQYVERELVDELFNELGRLAKSPNKLSERLRALGFLHDPAAAVQLVERVFLRMWTHAVEPPSPEWRADSRIGIPNGGEVPPCLDSMRMLTNYWDQCLMGYLALARGLRSETPIVPPGEGEINFPRFLRLRAAIRESDGDGKFDFSRHSVDPAVNINCLSLNGASWADVFIPLKGLMKLGFIEQGSIRFHLSTKGESSDHTSVNMKIVDNDCKFYMAWESIPIRERIGILSAELGNKLSEALSRVNLYSIDIENRQELDEMLEKIVQEVAKPKPRRSLVTAWLHVIGTISEEVADIVRGACNITALLK